MCRYPLHTHRNAHDIVSYILASCCNNLMCAVFTILFILKITGCMLSSCTTKHGRIPTAKFLWCRPFIFHRLQQSQHSLMQVDVVGRTPALEVATAGPQTPLELAASVATAAPGHHHQSSSSAPNLDIPGVLLQLHMLVCFMHFDIFIQ